ncbi:RNA-binding domain-containing protein [Microthyrium microscopicum]|uniref:RNA-binding domain-containing protein n=1 Tax=Microthyrium microscopicum TaxID=703497 RepID=A0A6A6UHE7_9PEZI|nr:RNA-binding domain-containing protein [Microthyrium microscopicum]
MSHYPNPPPLNKNSQSTSTHPSLPARPPAPANPLPAYKNGNTNGGGRGGYASSMSFMPRSVATQPAASGWQQQYTPAVSANPVPSTGYQQSGYTGQYYAQPSMGAYPQPGAYASPPQATGPYAAPDPDLDAQIAQWQSAYVSKDDPNAPKNGVAAGGNANYTPLGPRPSGNIDVGNATAPDSGVAAVVSGADGTQKTVVRSGGGKTWQDPSLLEWDPAHPRLFIGNLAGEVTDDSLLKAFSQYSSVQKAKVIRDKRSSKSKGFGFVSFRNSDDYFQAAKDMNGKYIGSHPVLIKRSTTEIKSVVPDASKGKKGSGGGRYLGANTNSGVHKKQKKKGGLKLLG